MRYAASLILGLFLAAAATATAVAQPYQAAARPAETAPGAALVEPGWQKVENGACMVWNAEPKASETAYWSGDCPDGAVNGVGTLTWIYQKDGAWIRIDHYGVFRNGRQHGPITTKAGVVPGPYFSG